MTLTLDHDPVDRDAQSRTNRTGPTDRSPRAVDAPPRLRWWRQIVLVLVFYALYTIVRGQFGSATASVNQAAVNASVIMELERRLGIGNELALQQWFLSWPELVRLINIFYGLFHFVVPIAMLATLLRCAPLRYRRWRDTLAATTALGLIGFSLFPLMPPRLLCACPYGSGVDSGFVDTLARYGGLWSFGSHGVGAVSNQYAAMPSLHFAWALWCALAAREFLPRGRWRRFALAYPAVTLVVIVVTANHFWLDAAGGAVVLFAGYGVARMIERLRREGRRRRARTLASPTGAEPGRTGPRPDPRTGSKVATRW